MRKAALPVVGVFPMRGAGFKDELLSLLGHVIESMRISRARAVAKSQDGIHVVRDEIDPPLSRGIGREIDYVIVISLRSRCSSRCPAESSSPQTNAPIGPCPRRSPHVATSAVRKSRAVPRSDSAFVSRCWPPHRRGPPEMRCGDVLPCLEEPCAGRSSHWPRCCFVCSIRRAARRDCSGRVASARQEFIARRHPLSCKRSRLCLAANDCPHKSPFTSSMRAHFP